VENNFISGQRSSADIVVRIIILRVGVGVGGGGDGGDGDGSVGPNSTRALPVVSFAPPIGTQPLMHPQLPSAGCSVAIITRGAMWSKLLVVVVYLVIVVTGTIPIYLFILQ